MEVGIHFEGSARSPYDYGITSRVGRYVRCIKHTRKKQVAQHSSQYIGHAVGNSSEQDVCQSREAELMQEAEMHAAINRSSERENRINRLTRKQSQRCPHERRNSRSLNVRKPRKLTAFVMTDVSLRSWLTRVTASVLSLP